MTYQPKPSTPNPQDTMAWWRIVLRTLYWVYLTAIVAVLVAYLFEVIGDSIR